jgi:predicted transcriptional regulator
MAELEIAEDVREILKVYLAHNPLPPEKLPTLMREAFTEWKILIMGKSSEVVQPAVEKPLAWKETIQGDKLICLEDNKPVVLLKRHLQQHCNMTPAEYIAKWNLPADYPMVAPQYSERRKKIAKETGLGLRS